MNRARTSKFAALLVALLLAAPAHLRADDENDAAFPGDVPDMHEEHVDAGIVHKYTGPWEYFVGGGGTSFDCNGDRLPDLFLAGGTSEATLYVNKSKTGGPLKFEQVDMGVPADDLKKVLGAYAIDIDNDGIPDLVLLRLGENIVLKGKGNCKFEKANKDFAFPGGRDWTTSFSAIWEKGQTFPTMAIGNYVDRTAPGSPFGTCASNFLLRPNGKDKPDYSEPVTLNPGYCALSMLFTDWNQSGEPSLRIANDRQYYRGGQEQLWSLNGGGQPKLYTTGQGWQTLKIWGMGIAEADLNADGYPEYAITSMGDTKLQTLDDEAEEDRPTYRDFAYEKGATAHRPYRGTDRKPSTGWHAEFADFNNDTNWDLFIAKGNVEAMPDFAADDPDNMLLGGFDGKFHEEGHKAGIDLPTKGRGAVIDDFNNDGMLDLVVINREQPASFFRNLGAKTDWGHRPMGNFAAIELDNGKINHFGIGARINIRIGTKTLVKTVQVGGGHASGHLGPTHFGLGVNERAVVRVQWPDGEWSQPYRIFANQHVVIQRGATAAKYWFAADVTQ